jgi:hypothetical protein
MSWGTNGEFLSAGAWPSTINVLKNWGDKTEQLTTIDASKNEGCHLLPWMLPGDNAALFTIWANDGTFDDSKIAVLDLKSKERKNLSYNGVEIHGTSPRFLQASFGNYMVWARAGNLYAALFDLSGLNVSGPEIKVMEGISENASSGKASYALTEANNGTLVYMPGKADTAKFDLVWVDRTGTETKASVPSGPYLMPMVANNGRALVILTGSVYKIGAINFAANNVDILFGGGDNNTPRITPDGTSYVFVSNYEDGKYNVYLSRLDGIGGPKKIVATEGGYPEISNLSPDGKYILYANNPDAPQILLKDISGTQPPAPLFASGPHTQSPMFSPDGKHIAYRSDEVGGKYKLFVTTFPVTGAKVQVSIDDGYFPQWSADGAELFYRDGESIMAARIQLSPSLTVLSRRLVCRAPYVSSSFAQPDFSVAPDGRILVLKSSVDQSKPVKVNVIVNWFTDLKKKLASQQ